MFHKKSNNNKDSDVIVAFKCKDCHKKQKGVRLTTKNTADFAKKVAEKVFNNKGK